MSVAQTINGALRRVPAWPIYVVGVIPPAWLLYLGLNGGLGADPVKELEHQMGLLALKLLIAGLCVTPLRRITGISLIRFRRAIGLVAFFYVVLHLLVWIGLDMGLLFGQALRDIVKRPYITIGMVGFVAMIPLAVTSNNWSIRRLGPQKWQRLHRLVYLSALAGALHYVWLVKAWPLQPLVYMGIILGLLVLRMPQIRGLIPAVAR